MGACRKLLRRRVCGEPPPPPPSLKGRGYEFVPPPPLALASGQVTPPPPVPPPQTVPDDKPINDQPPVDLIPGRHRPGYNPPLPDKVTQRNIQARSARRRRPLSRPIRSRCPIAGG